MPSVVRNKKMDVEENVDETLVRKQTSEHLLNIGNYLSNSCPSASRFYMYNLERRHLENPDLLKNYAKLSHQFCHYCGSIWSPSNCKIDVQKRQALNCHLKNLLNLEANQPWKLNSRQKKKLRKFRGSTSKLVYNCLSCRKKSVYPGSKQSNVKCHYIGQSSSSSTPLSKIKPKKSDLNAGLFIASPCNTDTNERNNLEKSDSSERSRECETPPQNKEKTLSESPITPGNKGKILNTPQSGNKVTPKNIKQTPILQVSSTEKPSTSKKKKKTLLGQILNQEQSKKKKTSLSSFLISL